MKKRVMFVFSLSILFVLLCAGVYAADIVTVGDDGNPYSTTPSVSISAVDANTIFISYLYLSGNQYNIKFARTSDGGKNWDTQTILTGTSWTMIPYLYAVSKDILFISYYLPCNYIFYYRKTI